MCYLGFLWFCYWYEAFIIFAWLCFVCMCKALLLTHTVMHIYILMLLMLVILIFYVANVEKAFCLIWRLHLHLYFQRKPFWCVRSLSCPAAQRDGCPKIVNLGSSKTDLFYERKKYGFKKRWSCGPRRERGRQRCSSLHRCSKPFFLVCFSQKFLSLIKCFQFFVSLSVLLSSDWWTDA